VRGGKPRLDVKWVVAAILVLAAIGVVAWPEVPPKPPSARLIRKTLLTELWPITLKNCTLERFGSPYDGGYLMCGNLLGNIQSAYSYGIGSDDWGCQVSRRFRVPVHQYDCFNPAQPACPGGTPVFHSECIAPKAQTVESRVFDTLSNQISRNGDGGKTLVAKIDVEGAELDSLLATPNRVLARFDQLVMEIHGTDERFLELIRKLKRTFYVVHLHFNNHVCDAQSSPLAASAYQASFVNKRIGVPDSRAPKVTLPHRLDAPDTPLARDCEIVS
jgi:hypothetical protein